MGRSFHGQMKKRKAILPPADGPQVAIMRRSARTNDKSTTRESDGRAFIALDGLRGVAALAVAIRHSPFLWPSGYPKSFFHESYLAVDFFFVLSGFILSYAYAERLRGGMSVSRFMTVRLFRLYPLYLFAFCIALVVAIAECGRDGGDPIALAINALYSALFIPSTFNKSELFPFNPPAWSLFFELMANVLFAMLGRQRGIGPFILLGGISAATLVLSASFGVFGFGASHGPLDAGTTWASFGAGMARVGYSFFAGIVCYRLWVARPRLVTVHPMILVGALCAVLMSFPPPAYAVYVDVVAVLLVFPLIVFLGAGCIVGSHASVVFACGGRISYGVYVLQVPLYALLSFLIWWRLGDNFAVNSISFGVISIFLIVAVAWLADKYFDQPVRRRLMNLSK